MHRSVSLFVTAAFIGVVGTACSFSLSGGSSSGGSSGSSADSGAAADSGGTSNNNDASADSGGDASTIDAGSCPYPVSVSSLPTWQPPSQQTAACNTSDIGILSSYLSEGDYDGAYGVTLTSSACHACVFSSVSDSHWQPVVLGSTSGSGFLNVGACYALAVNGSISNECGAAGQAAYECTQKACPASCTNQSSCQQAASSGTCASTTVVESDCPNYTTLESECASPANVIEAVCGSGAG